MEGLILSLEDAEEASSNNVKGTGEKLHAMLETFEDVEVFIGERLMMMTEDNFWENDWGRIILDTGCAFMVCRKVWKYDFGKNQSKIAMSKKRRNNLVSEYEIEVVKGELRNGNAYFCLLLYIPAYYYPTLL